MEAFSFSMGSEGLGSGTGEVHVLKRVELGERKGDIGYLNHSATLRTFVPFLSE